MGLSSDGLLDQYVCLLYGPQEPDCLFWNMAAGDAEEGADTELCWS